MDKIINYTITLFAMIIIAGCSNNDKIEGLKANQIIVVTVDIEDDINLEKVLLNSSGGKDSLLNDQLADKRKLKLKTPLKGEGTYTICIYTSTDTICSQAGYV